MHVKTPMRAACACLNLSTSPDRIRSSTASTSPIPRGGGHNIDGDVEADMVISVPDGRAGGGDGLRPAGGIPATGWPKPLRRPRFIQPGGMRELGVRTKLNALTRNVRGKRLILVDDSIVRGATKPQDRRIFCWRAQRNCTCAFPRPRC